MDSSKLNFSQKKKKKNTYKKAVFIQNSHLKKVN